MLVLGGHVSAVPLWACEYWSLVGMSEGTLICVKMIEMFIESAFATDCI
jgi:hypothetical protein